MDNKLQKTGQNSLMDNFVKTDDILNDMCGIIESSQKAAYQAVNTTLIQRNWLLGYRIAEEELQGEDRAKYGAEVIKKLAKELSAEYGRGYTKSNLYSFYSFYKTYPEIFQTPSGKSVGLLSWSHYSALLQVKDHDARAWYEKEAAEQTWSVRTLQRNISSQYYYRMLKTQKKEKLRRKDMKLKKRLLVCTLLLICICSLAGCKKGSQKDNEKSGKLSVVTTIFPYYDFVKNIAGDKVELSMIVPAGQDLHSFKPDSTDMSNVLKADVLIYNSGTSEKWVDSLLKVKSKEAKKIKKVPMMDNASDIVSSLNEDGDIKEQTGQREYDEHLWTSPVCAKKIVSIIEEKLCDADKENADYYKKNAKKYIKKLEDVDYELREVSENAGIKHLIFADGFSMRYLASELGLAYSAAYPVCGGYQKPKKQTISYLEERIKEEKIPVIFKSENDKSDVAEKIAKKTGAKVEVFNTCHMVSAKQLKNGVSYIELMNENIKLLKKALKFKG